MPHQKSLYRILCGIKKQNYLICHKYRRCYSKIQRATARELARSLMRQSPHQTVDKITLMCASTQRAILPLFMWLVAYTYLCDSPLLFDIHLN